MGNNIPLKKDDVKVKRYQDRHWFVDVSPKIAGLFTYVASLLFYQIIYKHWLIRIRNTINVIRYIYVVLAVDYIILQNIWYLFFKNNCLGWTQEHDVNVNIAPQHFCFPREERSLLCVSQLQLKLTGYESDLLSHHHFIS